MFLRRVLAGWDATDNPSFQFLYLFLFNLHLSLDVNVVKVDKNNEEAGQQQQTQYDGDDEYSKVDGDVNTPVTSENDVIESARKQIEDADEVTSLDLDTAPKEEVGVSTSTVVDETINDKTSPTDEVNEEVSIDKLSDESQMKEDGPTEISPIIEEKEETEAEDHKDQVENSTTENAKEILEPSSNSDTNTVLQEQTEEGSRKNSKEEEESNSADQLVEETSNEKQSDQAVSIEDQPPVTEGPGTEDQVAENSVEETLTGTETGKNSGTVVVGSHEQLIPDNGAAAMAESNSSGESKTVGETPGEQVTQ